MAVAINSTNINAARQLLDHPLFDEIFADMEAGAINHAIAAALSDDETRAAYLSEARAIRALRQKLRLLIAQGEAASGDRGASA